MTDAATRAHQLETQELLGEIRDLVKPEKPVMEMRRAGFDALPLAKQAEFVRGGGRVFDPPAADRSPLAAPDEMPKVLLRSTWERWPSADQARFVRGGGKLHDR
jgi:hypothetical protein